MEKNKEYETSSNYHIASMWSHSVTFSDALADITEKMFLDHPNCISAYCK